MEINSKVCGICKTPYVGDYCPRCAGHQSETMPLPSRDTNVPNSVCFTEPVGNIGYQPGGYSETRPANDTVNIAQISTQPAPGSGPMSGSTMPVGFEINDNDPFGQTRPPKNDRTMPADLPTPYPVREQQCVVGWLVATTGKHQGKDYQLRGFNTSIGREEGQIILDDKMVSRVNSCSIKYYSEVQQFYLYMGGNATNPVYVNGAPLHDHQELHAYDDLLIGHEHYVFVPLCGKTFQWEKR